MTTLVLPVVPGVASEHCVQLGGMSWKIHYWEDGSISMHHFYRSCLPCVCAIARAITCWNPN